MSAESRFTENSDSEQAKDYGMEKTVNGKHGNSPLNVAVTIDINDIYDGSLKVLKRIRPFWPISNIKFKV